LAGLFLALGASAGFVYADATSTATTTDATATSTVSAPTASTSTAVVTAEITVLNQQIADSKDKIAQLETTIVGYNKTIADKQTQAVSLKNQLSILDSRIAQVQADVDLTQAKLAETQLEINELKLSITNKQNSIDRQKQILNTMIQQINGNDQKNYIEIALTYNTFADFYAEMKDTESVYSDIGQSVRQLRLAREDLDNRKIEAEQKQQSYKDLQQELLGKKDALNAQVNVKQTLLNETKLSEQKYQTLLSSLKNQYQVIQTEEQTFEAQVRKKLEEQDKIQRTGSVLMSWPVPSHIINATFHDPNYPYRQVMEHSGIDIHAAQGTPVKAAAPGYVARAKHCATAACYSYIIIIHTGNISSLYGHLSGISVQEDQYVNRGDVIGASGGTPGSVGSGPFVTGPHLHFEVRLNGIPVDPVPYME